MSSAGKSERLPTSNRAMHFLEPRSALFEDELPVHAEMFSFGNSTVSFTLPPRPPLFDGEENFLWEKFVL